MGSQLLVKVYNVGLGDCIYVRVPDKRRDVHILIDCGNKFGELGLLGQCIADLRKELPKSGNGKVSLDLLVVTHPHEDHHKGFEEEFFKDIQIERIWLSPAFDRMNPKAQGFHALQDAAQRALRSLSLTALGDIKEEIDELLSLSKDEAIDMLCNKLPQANGIQPLFVTADTPPEQLKIFEDPRIQLKVLGPMEDIDSYYIGGDGLANALSGAQGLAGGYQSMFPVEMQEVEQPENISAQDFEVLRGRMRPNALAAAEVAGHAVNNLSVVLLLEWRGRRLLFPGDAEWSGKIDIQVKKGKSNCSWNVMWQERNADLAKPVDFLKIGHHGSENATPWAPVDKNGNVPSINQVLDALLPLPQAGKKPKAMAIASTLRTRRWVSIPNPELMIEIGKRVANAQSGYNEDPSRLHVPANFPQPQRTDLEEQAMNKPVPFIPFRLKPVRGR